MVALLFLPVGFFMKKLYLWASIADPAAAFKAHLISRDQAHAILFKHPMLSIPSVWIQTAICFGIWFLFIIPLNRWSLQRDADTLPNVRSWQIKFENASGIGIVIYSLTMTAVAIDWVMSLDVTWYSSMYGFLFLVGQAYAAFAVCHPDDAQVVQGRADQDAFALQPNKPTWAALLLPLSCSISTSPSRNF